MDNLETLVTSLGALAEMCKLFYDDLIGQGFTKQQAIILVSKLVEGAAGGSKNE